LKKYIDVLKTVSLFEGIEESMLEPMLACLGSTVGNFKKHDIIFLTESEISSVGIVLSGSVQIVKEDILGNRMILAQFHEGELFGESLACAGLKKSPVTVLAASGCEILFIQFKKIVTVCSSVCNFHTTLIENMLRIIANKNILLNNKIDIIFQKTTREKLLAYFMTQIKKSGSKSFEIPFSRDELADYLCVNRSAMSRELGKMRDEGLLKFNKNKFELFV